MPIALPETWVAGLTTPLEKLKRWIGSQGAPVSTEIAAAEATKLLPIAKTNSVFAAFFENAPADIVMFDRDMRYLQASRRWHEHKFIAEEDAIGRTFEQIFPGAPPHWIEICKRCLDGQASRHDEERIDLPNGGVEWLKWEVLPWRDANGDIGGIMMMTEDITSLKEAEQNLITLSARMQVATSGAGIGVWEWQIDAPDIWIDQQSAKIIGVPLADSNANGQMISGKFWVSAIHPDDTTKLSKAFEKAAISGNEIVEAYRIVRKDTGETRYLKTHITRRTDLKTKIDCFVGISWDITAAVEAEAALAESEERFRSLFEAIPVAVALNSHDGKFEQTNHVLCEMTGYTAEELANLTFMDLTPPEFAAREEEMRKITFSTGRYGPYEKEYIRKDGNRIPVLLHGGLATDRHGETRLWSIIEDISAQKLAEEMLRQAKDSAETAKQEAERANQAKSVFLANMSHEIRTPMNGILGMLGLLQTSKLTEDQRKYLVDARTSAESLMGIINDILDFSKLEAGRIDLDNVDFSPEREIDQVFSLLKPQADAKGIQLQALYPENTPHWFTGDPNRFRQVIFNLVGNALKFTEVGGVTVELSLSNLSSATAEICVEVRDTGIGIPREVCGKLFQRFTQADASTTRKFGGTGLGLAICRQLVELMHGSISVTSELGKGSNFLFKVVLALGHEQTSVEQDTVKIEKSSHALRILVAEDNRINQRLVRAMLRRDNWHVDIANNGLEVLDMIEKNPYDVILMDVMMPGMDGVTATQKIRALPGDVANIYIIALTANAMTGDREQYIAAGMQDYLSKPISPQALYDALDRVGRIVSANKRALVNSLASASPILDMASLDQDHLAALRQSIGTEQLRIILEDLPGEIDELVADVVNAVDKQNRDLLRAAAHALHGVSENFGARRLAALTHLLENSAEKENSAVLREFAEMLQAATKDLQTNMRSWMQSA